MSWLSKWFNTIQADFASIWTGIKPAVQEDMRLFMSTFADIALAAVMEQAPMVMSGQEKFSAASKLVLDKSISMGWKVALPMVQQLIQQTVVATKASMGGILVIPPNETGDLVDNTISLPATG